MTHFLTRSVLAAACVVALAAPAWAHAHLQTSTPGAGSKVSSAPFEISMEFTEGLELAFSGVSVTDEKGAAVSLDAPVLDVNAKQLSAKFTGLLLPGSYHVTWHELSKDGHKTDGKFEFAVGP